MKPHLSSVFALISLLLFALVIALWIRSYFIQDAIPGSFNTATLQLQSGHGRLWISRVTVSPGPRLPFSVLYEWNIENLPALPFSRQKVGKRFIGIIISDYVAPNRLGNGYGFGILTGGGGGGTSRVNYTFSVHTLSIPYWSLAAALLLMPVIVAVRLIRQRTAVQIGHCRHCGYDLRATPLRCPECGRPS